MKKTPRRSSGKQIAGALATLPIATLATSPGTSAPTANQEKPRRTARDPVESSHDTPPPVLLMNGSVIVETEEPDFNERDTVPGQRKKYRRVRAGRKVYLGHIKVIDGSGEMLYRGDYHPGPGDFSIAVTTSENDVINLAPSGNKFQIDTASNKKLEKTIDPIDQPMGAKRKGRFRYKDDSGADQISIKKVAIKKGSAGVFEVVLDDLSDDGQELKVMMWLEERLP